ncbi:ribosome small subunit-dependent GTPase A [Micromonosporaceae bacterium DT194]|uniref:ribosome small subunit-dependent GTPase A n=1 Tax=Melissospora conviva TaxID=3388432 RepID=UPI003C2A64C2
MNIDLTALGWTGGNGAGSLRPGRVTRVDRGVCTVLCAEGPVRASLAGRMLATAAGDLSRLPAVGDWVRIGLWPDERTTVEEVLPRRSLLSRRTAGKDASAQVLAANMDAVAVVEPVHPEPDLPRIERLLALAFESGAQPLVVLSKADLAADAEMITRDLARVAPGVPVLPVSAERGTGIDLLRPYVAAGRTLALLGRSGAGKSSLVNALVDAEVLATQAIRRADGKGRHTTTYRTLVPVPGGGAVIDTPGVRGVGLLDAADGLDQAFADVTELIDCCRFADCAHRLEPGCAVRAALADGELSLRRWESWEKLQREVAYETGRQRSRPRGGRQFGRPVRPRNRRSG